MVEFSSLRQAQGAEPAQQGAQRAQRTQVHRDLQRARGTLVEAELALQPSDRFLSAHLAALQVAAVVLLARAHRTRRGSRPRNAWRLLAEVAPELGEWAAFFAATEGKRDVVRSGASTIVTAREADDLVRDAQTFFSLVERRLDRPRHDQYRSGSNGSRS